MLYAIVGMLVIIADQYIKFWVQGHIAVNTSEEFIPGILSLANVHNDGAAFGFLAGSGIRLPFIILAAVFAIVVILALATNLISGKLARWSIVLVTAGGLSNCLDRVLYGYVQDMFKLEFINFPVFNLADVFITVFAIIFALAVIFGKTRKDRDEDEDDDFLDDEEEEPAPKRKPKRKSRRARREEEEEDEDDEDEEEPPRPAPKKTAKRSRKQAEEEEVPVPAPKKAAASRSSARTKPAAPAQEEDPFAAWERANAKAKAVKDRQSAVVQAASRPGRRPETGTRAETGPEACGKARSKTGRTQACPEARAGHGGVFPRRHSQRVQIKQIHGRRNSVHPCRGERRTDRRSPCAYYRGPEPERSPASAGAGSGAL